MAFEVLLVVLVAEYQAIPDRPPVIPLSGQTDCDLWEWDCSIPVSSSFRGTQILSRPLVALL